MSNNQTINGRHLKNARLYRGRSLSDLSKETEISKQTLSLYENGAIKPNITNLFALSKALHFPAEYFLTDDDVSVTSETTYFRSLLSTSKLSRTSQSIYADFIAQFYSVLSEYVDFPLLNLPKINFDIVKNSDCIITEAEIEQIESSAQLCRDFWQLGKGPIQNLQDTLETNGIIISFGNKISKEIDAYSQKTHTPNGDIFVMVINKDKSFVRIRFDMAHELGHILLHPWSESLDELPRNEFKYRESQANIFASAFLLPRESFSNDVSKYPNNFEYYIYLKRKWNVSIQAMIYRTRQLKIISDGQYQYFMRKIGAAGFKQNEPGDVPYINSKTLAGEAIDLILDSGQATVSSILSTIKRHGLFLESTDIEDILSLAPGTLRTVESSSKIIKLKLNNKN